MVGLQQSLVIPRRLLPDKVDSVVDPQPSPATGVRAEQSRALSLVQIHRDTVLWLAGIMMLLCQLSFTHKDTAQGTQSPLLRAFLAFRWFFTAIRSIRGTLTYSPSIIWPSSTVSLEASIASEPRSAWTNNSVGDCDDWQPTSDYLGVDKTNWNILRVRLTWLILWGVLKNKIWMHVQLVHMWKVQSQVTQVSSHPKPQSFGTKCPLLGAFLPFASSLWHKRAGVATSVLQSSRQSRPLRVLHSALEIV